MKLIIDISEGDYAPFKFGKYIIVGGLRGNGKTLMSAIYKAVANGTPIPDNATNGDVIKLLFQDDDLGIEVIEGNIRFNLGDDWWNAPYKAESEERND